MIGGKIPEKLQTPSTTYSVKCISCFSTNLLINLINCYNRIERDTLYDIEFASLLGAHLNHFKGFHILLVLN